MARPESLPEIADQVRSELEKESDFYAKKLFNEDDMPDVEKLSKQDFLNVIRTRWSDPTFRAKHFESLGPQQGLESAMEAFGLDKSHLRELEKLGEKGDPYLDARPPGQPA